MMLWVALGAVALSLGISLLATPLSRRVAHRFGMLDVPGRRKAHTRPVPLLGGCAIFAAIVGPSLLALGLARIWAARGVPYWVPELLAQHGLDTRKLRRLGIPDRFIEHAPRGVQLASLDHGLQLQQARRRQDLERPRRVRAVEELHRNLPLARAAFDIIPPRELRRPPLEDRQ